MKDDNWELIQGDAAHEIEVLNYSNQVNVIEALVHLFMHHNRAEDGTCAVPPNANVIREFHRTATLFLLLRPGEYRDCPVLVTKGDEVIHTPPEFGTVPQYIDDFITGLGERWMNASPQEIGAYALWMINWIHPFKNGNGRTARAFCYACISLKLGFVIPGSPTVIDLIMDQREDYYAALKVADLAFASNQSPDLAPMTDFIDRLLEQQFLSIG